MDAPRDSRGRNPGGAGAPYQSVRLVACECDSRGADHSERVVLNAFGSWHLCRYLCTVVRAPLAGNSPGHVRVVGSGDDALRNSDPAHGSYPALVSPRDPRSQRAPALVASMAGVSEHVLFRTVAAHHRSPWSTGGRSTPLVSSYRGRRLRAVCCDSTHPATHGT